MEARRNQHSQGPYRPLFLVVGGFALSMHPVSDVLDCRLARGAADTFSIRTTDGECSGVQVFTTLVAVPNKSN
jgi:hypothetical protein